MPFLSYWRTLKTITAVLQHPLSTTWGWPQSSPALSQLRLFRFIRHQMWIPWPADFMYVRLAGMSPRIRVEPLPIITFPSRAARSCLRLPLETTRRLQLTAHLPCASLHHPTRASFLGYGESPGKAPCLGNVRPGSIFELRRSQELNTQLGIYFSEPRIPSLQNACNSSRRQRSGEELLPSNR